MRRFNTTGPCIPGKHYMVDLTERLAQICGLVDGGAYFTVNYARQYGKTTTLAELEKELTEKYLVISLDFQRFSDFCFESERNFCYAFAAAFSKEAGRFLADGADGRRQIEELASARKDTGFNLMYMFELLRDFCERSDKPVVLVIDEVDYASNNRVILDFLSQLRYGYLDRELRGMRSFHSVILAAVYDVRNIRRKIRPVEHNVNSPWNIAADFEVDMSFSKEGIAGMLREYEADNATGMDVSEMASMLYDYTSGYPFLVSRLCKLMDEKIRPEETGEGGRYPWTKKGFHEAVRLILSEENALFGSMIGKLADYSELNTMLSSLLFAGEHTVYNPDNLAISDATMFGFVKNRQGNVAIANRIFEARLYNYYLSTAE